MKRIIILAFLVTAIFATTTTIQAENLPELTVVESSEGIYRMGRASILEKEEMGNDRATLFFFGGKRERSSPKDTANLLKDIAVLDGWNVTAIAIHRDPESRPISIWKEVAKDLVDYVTTRVHEGKIDPSRIYLDGYSNGSAGAYYATLALQGKSVVMPDGSTVPIEVKRLTLIEGTLRGIIKSAQVEEILSLGIPLTLYVSRGSTYNLSEHGRKLVREFSGTPGFTGIMVDHGHGSAIVKLVYEEPYRNHWKEE